MPFTPRASWIVTKGRKPEIPISQTIAPLSTRSLRVYSLPHVFTSRPVRRTICLCVSFLCFTQRAMLFWKLSHFLPVPRDRTAPCPTPDPQCHLLITKSGKSQCSFNGYRIASEAGFCQCATEPRTHFHRTKTNSCFKTER